jgi:hypothetical protein
MTYINGFDHPHIIAGAGTMGMEIIEQVPDVDAVVVPVGGAGLIAGVSVAVKALRPECLVIVSRSPVHAGPRCRVPRCAAGSRRILCRACRLQLCVLMLCRRVVVSLLTEPYLLFSVCVSQGVEPESVPSLKEALRCGEPTEVPANPTLADGLLVPKVGANAFAIARSRVDRVVLVKEMYIALAVRRCVPPCPSHVAAIGRVMPCRVLSCPLLSSPVLSCPLLSSPVLSCPLLSSPVLSCPLLLCRIGSCDEAVRW